MARKSLLPTGTFIKGYPPTGQHIDCAHEDCGFFAIVRVKTLQGWAAFCLKHYDAYWLYYAIRFNSNPSETKEEDEKINGISYRNRWYLQRKIPYEKPKLSDYPPFRCIANESQLLSAKLLNGDLGKRMRQAGEDEQEAA